MFLKKDKLCSGLKDEITVLVVNNNLEALADLLKQTPWACYDRHEASLGGVEDLIQDC